MTKPKTVRKSLTSKLINAKTKKKVKELGEQASQLLVMAKNKYESLDPKTKKKVLEGIAFTAGLVATAVVAKKVASKKKKTTAKKVVAKKKK